MYYSAKLTSKGNGREREGEREREREKLAPVP